MLGIAERSDTSDPNAIDSLLAVVKERFGALDILFLNAGVGRRTPLESATEEDFAHIFDTNVKGVFFTVQKALPLLRSGASIILNASTASRTGRPGLSLYAASKGAVRTLARSFSAELCPRGIRVNVVSPGPIDTPIWDREQKPENSDRVRQQVAAGVPIGRMGRPEEVAQVVVFLASDESSFLLGTEITVDGGLTELPVGVAPLGWGRG
jgi:NAD(P)-dependent dehydrogenase (short-subunit alcohol dehydrogenase family)